MTRAYYNENDIRAAAWLRKLIEGGHIAEGDVDTRSIEDVLPSDIDGYTQCHFFAGIGGWSYALRAAGWPDDRPVWTGSCPCQPFSTAGQRAGFADQRHLWPSWHWLIKQRRPSAIYGEQVAKRAGLAWFDLVSTDLEGEGYACGAALLSAAGVGAPHLRERIYWVAVGHPVRWSQQRGAGISRDVHTSRGDYAYRCSPACRVADNGHAGLEINCQQQTRPERAPIERSGTAGRLGLAPGGRRERGRDEPEHCIPMPADPWSDCAWLPCRDGRSRPVEPGTFPLAHGVSGRVGLLRGYGNAIVPQVATEFILATC